MPKGEDEPLSAKEIADLKAWIAQGAPWAAGAATAANAAAPAAAKPHAKPVPYPR